jgi:trimethylamine-N-oxide reductase (cytochrome c)
MTELDWVRRMFDASDLPRHISWKRFIRKGYYVVPPPPEPLRAPVAFRWFREGRRKDVPEPHPLPAGYVGQWGMGLQTASGKFEFAATSLGRLDPPDPDRPAVLHYMASREGAGSERAGRFPLQLVISHPRFSFHTHVDGKGSFVNQIEEHRVIVNGRAWWVLRMNPADAALRGIAEGQLVKVFNERGAVICAARLTPRVRPGVMHSCEASARYEPADDVELGGALNVLTPKESQTARVHSVGHGNCLVEVRPWAGAV